MSLKQHTMVGCCCPTNRLSWSLIRACGSPVETLVPNGSEPPSVLDVALSLDLKGPPDWAMNIDQYLYGKVGESEEDGPGDAK
jgi:hypothetical protein